MVGSCLLLLLQVAADKETLPVPGTTQTHDLVRISGAPGLRPFSIGAREVTWFEYNQYAEVAAQKVDGVTRPTIGKAYFGDAGVPQEFLRDTRPATNVRWHGALGYCEWLSRKTGRYYRLPTEKEWEFAARAGEPGAAPAALDDVAWHDGNSGKQTHDVGGKKPNAFGLYDTLGNVWEYCLETGPAGFVPALRGGSWTAKAANLGFASRRTIPEDWFSADCHLPRSVWWLVSNRSEQGFRVLCVVGAADAKERDAAVPKLPVKILSSQDADIRTGKSRDEYDAVTGELRNGTDRAIDELEVRIYSLTPQGKPHMTDWDVPNPGRATFASAWPVLSNGADPAAAAPLKPGETRTFVVHLPKPFDTDTAVRYGMFGGVVMNLRYAKD